MNLIQNIQNYISSDIEAMNALIIKSLKVDEELIDLVGNHIASSGGKRMRPMLTILSAKMFGYKGDNAIRIAAAVEFIHMATLLHDDVVDGSKMRRFLPTANTIWGEKASILVGDFMFSQSFKMIVSTELLSVSTILSNASAVIAEGEVAQLAQLESRKILSQSEYLRVIKAKTAELFASACEVGAIIAGKLDYTKRLREFGYCLGNIFQVADDSLDYFSDSDQVGKNVGDDFFEGKVTLPLILLDQKISDKDRVKLQKMIASKERLQDDFIYVKHLMQEHAIQDKIVVYLRVLKKEADALLDAIDIDNQCKEYLGDLVEFAISRTY